MRGPPLQTRVVAAYGTVSQLANMLVTKRHDDPGAHGNERGQMNGGKNVRWAVDMAGKDGKANKSPLNKALQATQPADAPSGTGLKKQTANRWLALQQTTTATKLSRLLSCR